ncbi:MULTISPECIES: FadR/GntR family transcriptional regulator [Achromobacter]|uniref:FadR/GntR family transcriptional regulator n=1 Tax=Achromobacter spanius TaxID=217203 RepID=A0ABY8GVS1_9BURK|nr:MULTISPECIES: FadR/GntR family transcriptional regulator [Achromobacter]WAI82130.1 FadR family transcriptional regulator [Achromobacter spanius]WEX92219.1 FadR family transcriptional regulator [Achromobacter sp. SS2-2022]WFP08634.1 FadR/GntR family transcriptional regulator [Achromobacter spanius]
MSDVRDPQLGSLLESASRPRPELDVLADVASGLGYVRAERFAERVYESLFYAIATGKIAPGNKLPTELELAALFEVSRPVVRQALDRLREDQLVDSIRGSGTYVRAKPDLMGGMPAVDPARRVGHILEGLELRMVIEPECAYLAALRRSSDDLREMDRMLTGYEEADASGAIAHHYDYGFHRAIATATSNQRFVQVLKSLEYDVSHAVNVMRHLVHSEPWKRTRAAIDEHRHIYRLIQEQDADGARNVMRAHIEKAKSRMLNSGSER